MWTHLPVVMSMFQSSQGGIRWVPMHGMQRTRMMMRRKKTTGCFMAVMVLDLWMTAWEVQVTWSNLEPIPTNRFHSLYMSVLMGGRATAPNPSYILEQATCTVGTTLGNGPGAVEIGQINPLASLGGITWACPIRGIWVMTRALDLLSCIHGFAIIGVVTIWAGCGGNINLMVIVHIRRNATMITNHGTTITTTELSPHPFGRRTSFTPTVQL
mmetsp:Transcript_12554/g.23173  ORF Transcript_12554/g.23173 Transcript_12554/m.23173 type:complete len:213 (+) Transcript_12554:70-708(+)